MERVTVFIPLVFMKSLQVHLFTAIKCYDMTETLQDTETLPKQTSRNTKSFTEGRTIEDQFSIDDFSLQFEGDLIFEQHLKPSTQETRVGKFP